MCVCACVCVRVRVWVCHPPTVPLPEIAAFPNQVVGLGDSVNITCSATSPDNIVTVSLTTTANNMNDLPTPAMNMSTFSLTNVMTDRAGNYTCTAVNARGPSSLTSQLYVVGEVYSTCTNFSLGWIFVVRPWKCIFVVYPEHVIAYYPQLLFSWVNFLFCGALNHDGLSSSSSSFSSCLSYALSCVGMPGLALKSKQLKYTESDVFLWVPTGYGKSICYQTLSFLLDAKLGRTSTPLTERSVVLVISPLVSLMVNQVVHFQWRRLLVCSLSLCGPSNRFKVY